MRRGWKFWLKIVGAVAGALLLMGASFGLWSTRRPFPAIDGEIRLSGLDGPVEVIRDSWGIPHIYASTLHDLFMAQGHVHAQDRFWQMDFSRHIASGRLAEMFGEDQADTDAFIRTLGWERVARLEWEALDPAVRPIMEAYAGGVNAYLGERSPAELSFEYTVLDLINRSYTPEPWEPVDTVAWGKVMSWTLSGNLDGEIARAVLSRTIPADRLEDLFPAYPQENPDIVGGYEGDAGAVAASLPSVVDPGAGLDVVLARTERLDALTGGPGEGIGSNSWVISGTRTASGKPLLANDPHLGIQMPSIWYQVGLHCAPVGDACPYDVAGFSFPGAPGVVIGHNARIAWGFTNLGPDVMDLYIEKLNPEDPDQYEVNGEWRDMETRTEVIEVAGGDDLTITVRSTRHGPVIDSTFEPLEDFAADAGIELPDRWALALRWTALDPSRTFEAILAMNLAGDWEEFRAAAAGFDAPSQNLVYADVDGNIGYQAPGRVPIRASGDGRRPVPGWDDEHEWVGFIPFEDLPSVLNPPQGYIVTANNRVVGDGYPYLLGTDWDDGYRAARIDQMMAGATGVTVEDVERMQLDTYNTIGERLTPYLTVLDFDDPLERRARDVLAGWDFHNEADSAGAAVFNAVWEEVLRQTYLDDFAGENELGGNARFFASSRFFTAVGTLLDLPDSAWWDDSNTPEREDRDTILRIAFTQGVATVARELGDDPAAWRWGRLHTATFRNQSLGDSGIGVVEGRFNRGPYETPGGSNIVNATGWTPLSGFEVDWVPSMRMIVDLADLDASVTVHTTGQSGHAYHRHYSDMVDLWREGEYYPMHWERASVEADAEGRLRLVPG